MALASNELLAFSTNRLFGTKVAPVPLSAITATALRQAAVAERPTALPPVIFVINKGARDGHPRPSEYCWENPLKR